MKKIRIHSYIRTNWFLQKTHRRFWKNSGVALQAIKQNERFSWSKECESVEQLKQGLQKAPILCYPNDTYPYTLTIEAFLVAIGVIISQRQHWGERVTAYTSETLRKSQRKYSAKNENFLR